MLKLWPVWLPLVGVTAGAACRASSLGFRVGPGCAEPARRGRCGPGWPALTPPPRARPRSSRPRRRGGTSLWPAVLRAARPAAGGRSPLRVRRPSRVAPLALPRPGRAQPFTLPRTAVTSWEVVKLPLPAMSGFDATLQTADGPIRCMVVDATACRPPWPAGASDANNGSLTRRASRPVRRPGKVPGDEGVADVPTDAQLSITTAALHIGETEFW